LSGLRVLLIGLNAIKVKAIKAENTKEAFIKWFVFIASN
jgi:hypothetical protein